MTFTAVRWATWGSSSFYLIYCVAWQKKWLADCKHIYVHIYTYVHMHQQHIKCPVDWVECAQWMITYEQRSQGSPLCVATATLMLLASMY